MHIESIEFSEEGIRSLEKIQKGTNWPVVYIIHNDRWAYIGETCDAMGRLLQHIATEERRILKRAEIIVDDEFNKSAILDTEQKLIRLCSSDKRFKLQNRNAGQSPSHEYYNRIHYEAKISDIWEKMIEMDLAYGSYGNLINKSLYKYSPYTSLTVEQVKVYSLILEDIASCIKNDKQGTYVVHGGAGTGKTILAMNMLYTLANLMKREVHELLIDSDEDPTALNDLAKAVKMKNGGKLKVAICTPLEDLRNVLQKVVSECGFGNNLVLGPSDIAKSNGDVFDVVIVDESHRLRIRKNIQDYENFDNCSKRLNLDPNQCSQLDWVILRSKYRILFYDEAQTVKGSDIGHEQFCKTIGDFKESYLKTQMRCLGGNTFIQYIDDILQCNAPKKEVFGDQFDLRLYDDVSKMISDIKDKDRQIQLCRVVSGYSWKWNQPRDKHEYKVEHKIYDIEIGGDKYIWNSKHNGWILSKYAVDEIGCIHSVQGFDLNYVGVIFGREIDYDPVTNCIKINRELFFDENVKKASDYKDLKKYVLNTYKVLLTRGVHGCYVYAYNENMRNYLRRFFDR